MLRIMSKQLRNISKWYDGVKNPIRVEGKSKIGLRVMHRGERLDLVDRESQLGGETFGVYGLAREPANKLGIGLNRIHNSTLYFRMKMSHYYFYWATIYIILIIIKIL